MTDHRPEPLNELRERFREAAAREMAAPVARHAVRRRRVIAVALAALGVSGGVAVATQLISTGSPRAEHPQKSRRYSVPDGAGAIAITAPDRDRPLPWGVLVYRSGSGEDCASVGQVRAGQLGEIRDGSFRPAPELSGGGCGDVSRAPFFVEVRYLDGRSLVFGRARRDVRTMRLAYRGRTRRASTGPGGAFLFVFDAGLRPADVELTPLASDGRALD